MKILFCANIFESAVVGPARFAENLLKINELYNGVHEVQILSADVKSRNESVHAFRYYCPKVLRIFDFLFHGLAYWWHIRRLPNINDFDIVLFGNAIYGLIPKLLGIGIPVVGMVNDPHCSTVSFSNFRQRTGGSGLLLLRLIEKWAVHCIDLVLANSEYLVRQLSMIYELPLTKTQRLYKGIDVQSVGYCPNRFKNTGSIKILFVKHRYDLGRLQDLAAALRNLGEYRFLVTVIGPPNIVEKMVEQLFNSTPNAQLNFIGPASQNIVHQELSKNDILCIPSFIEALGLANAEGLAHGISIVTTNVGGIPEVMDFGKNGWLCEPNNPKSLAESLRACIEAAPEERRQKSDCGRRFVEQNFHFTAMLDELLAVLHSVVKQSNG